MNSIEDCFRERAIAGGTLIELGRAAGPAGSVAFSRRLWERLNGPQYVPCVVDCGFSNFALRGGHAPPYDCRFYFLVDRDDGHEDAVEVRAFFRATPGGGVAVTYLEGGEPSVLAAPRGGLAPVM